MARAANRLRQQLRPEYPTDLAFEISEENIPADFLKADVCIRSKRHLVFATSQQLQQLVKAKNWYVNGTFKLCCQPFSQLFTINVFVKSGDQARQVPLLFDIMSGRKKRDYRAVVQEVLSILPSPPAVRRITLDFERALWTVLRQLLPDVSLQGCLFHWMQALWRKVSISNLHIQIKLKFQGLSNSAATTTLRELAKYVTDTWVTSTMWPPSCWSVYMLPIRTNNDIEGWHHSLNRSSNNSVHLPFYLLVELLHQEARLVSIQIPLVSHGKLSRI